MRTPSLILLTALTTLTACKDGFTEDTGTQIDADGDGVLASEDCDDDNTAVFPGAEEICDGLDNDCDEEVDNGATDATFWYPDADADTYGDLSGEVSACEAPLGHVADATDCDDTRAEVNPAAAEICNAGVDDDCDGLADDADDNIDLSTGVTWWADADADGFGAGAPARACEVPSGGADNEADCDDTSADTYPGAAEICDGLDNSCEGVVDEGVLGAGASCPAESCLDMLSAATTDGRYWIDPSSGDAFEAYCDLSSDGGGWTLVSWTNDTSILMASGYYQSEPYPGLDICSTLDCTYGSAGTVSQMQDLIQLSSEFGSGMSTGALSTYQTLAAYEYASAFTYGDLSSITLSVNTYDGCNSKDAIEGVNNVITGPTDYDGLAVWLSPELRYSSYEHTSNTRYLWSYGLSGPCQGSGAMPAVYLGTWSQSNYGPYLAATAGSRSTWVR